MIPRPLIDGLERYAEGHIATGGFLRSVLSGQLYEAVLRADGESELCLGELTRHIMIDLPANAWGSPEKVDAWLGMRT